jgi:hypothetical protein
VVTVAQGIYVENIQFGGRNIVLRSTNPTDPAVVAATVIDGNRARSVVTFDGTENASCVLSGFTIRNGLAVAGGGVRGNDALATIQLNLIGLNEANVGGGLHRCDGLITGNIITQNSAEGSGGGLSQCDGKVVNNVISQNSAEDGGGLANCLGEIRNNAIRHNPAEYAGGGLFMCPGSIQNNVVSGNSARYGGGMHSCDNIVNSTVVANSATMRGGGIHYQSLSDGDIANCIIWGNEALEGPQVYLDTGVDNPTYCCIQDWTEGGTGNFALEPDFTDPSGPDGDPSTTWDNDYRLSAISVCIDRGNNDAHAFPQLDRDGNLRIAYGNRSLTVDMGAFEYNSGRFAVTGIAPFDDASVSLTWNSQPNNKYTLWFLADASSTAWVKGPTVASQGSATSHNVPFGTNMTGYCIVEMVE